MFRDDWMLGLGREIERLEGFALREWVLSNFLFLGFFGTLMEEVE